MPFYVFRYDEVANNVQTQETILNIQFVLLDCSPLKYAILSHCTEWQNKFTTLLSTIATSRLKDLHAFLKDNGEKYAAFYLSFAHLGSCALFTKKLRLAELLYRISVVFLYIELDNGSILAIYS